MLVERGRKKVQTLRGSVGGYRTPCEKMCVYEARRRRLEGMANGRCKTMNKNAKMEMEERKRSTKTIGIEKKGREHRELEKNTATDPERRRDCRYGVGGRKIGKGSSQKNGAR